MGIMFIAFAIRRRQKRLMSMRTRGLFIPKNKRKEMAASIDYQVDDATEPSVREYELAPTPSREKKDSKSKKSKKLSKAEEKEEANKSLGVGSFEPFTNENETLDGTNDSFRPPSPTQRSFVFDLIDKVSPQVETVANQDEIPAFEDNDNYSAEDDNSKSAVLDAADDANGRGVVEEAPVETAFIGRIGKIRLFSKKKSHRRTNTNEDAAGVHSTGSKDVSI